MTGTIYRKKRNTVEFTPGKKPQTAPPPQPVPQRSGEPVGEPIEVPRSQPVPSGFTMQIGGLDTVPTDSTQEFMSAYNAVRPQRRQTAAQPRPTPAAQSPAPPPDAATKTPLLSGMPRRRRIARPENGCCPTASAMMWISWSIP